MVQALSPEDIFLRGIWALVGHKPGWVDRVAQQPGDDGPSGDYGPLLAGMLAKGVPAEDIERLAKIIAYETAFGFCYHLEDPIASYESCDDDAPKLSWGVFLIDDKDRPTGECLCSMHELFLSVDPSGDEMRPPGFSGRSS